MVGNQGSVFVTNHYFGAAINSSYGIAAQLSAHTQTLSNALMGALSPAVTTTEGSGDREGTIRLAFRTGKFGVFLMLLFAIPMALEMETLLKLWLGRIPEAVVPVCVLVLVAAILEKFTIGHQMAISAMGKVALWQLSGGVLNMLVFPAAWLFAVSGIGPISAAVAALCCPCCTFFMNLYFARRQVAMPVRPWLRQVFVPILCTALAALLVGGVSVSLLPPSWWRIGITTLICLAVILPNGWFLVLDAQEHEFVLAALRRMRGVKGG